MKKIIGGLTAAAALLALGSVAIANPITIEVNESQLLSDEPGATTLDFSQEPCGGYADCSGDFDFRQEGDPGLYAKPQGLDEEDYFLTVPFEQSAGNAVFDLGFRAGYFGMLWGSIDEYNTISFLLDGDEVGTFTGGDEGIAPADGDQNRSFYVDFFFADGYAFDSIQFTSTDRAFETANHAVRAVPEPGTLALLAALLLGVGLLRLQSAGSAG